jgi:hypothetical protein
VRAYHHGCVYTCLVAARSFLNLDDAVESLRYLNALSKSATPPPPPPIALLPHRPSPAAHHCTRPSRALRSNCRALALVFRTLARLSATRLSVSLPCPASQFTYACARPRSSRSRLPDCRTSLALTRTAPKIVAPPTKGQPRFCSTGRLTGSADKPTD